MKKAILVTLALAFLVSACTTSSPAPKKLTELTCDDDPTGRSKEEQMAIGDACFRKGSFVKSSGKKW